MNEFNKNAWLEKTEAYVDYIAQHKRNIKLAWGELKDALRNVDFLARPQILAMMQDRVEYHDNSKMREEEFLPYRQHFYPVDGEKSNDQDFQQAWERHYRSNDHHWQYWIDEGGNFIASYSVDDKLCAYLEMICDWQAMGYVFGDNAPTYYNQNKSKIKIDPNWTAFVEEVLQIFADYLMENSK